MATTAVARHPSVRQVRCCPAQPSQPSCLCGRHPVRHHQWPMRLTGHRGAPQCWPLRQLKPATWHPGAPGGAGQSPRTRPPLPAAPMPTRMGAPLRPPLRAQLLSTATDWLHRDRPDSPLSLMLVVGVPNVGKSSLINAIKGTAGASAAACRARPCRWWLQRPAGALEGPGPRPCCPGTPLAPAKLLGHDTHRPRPRAPCLWRAIQRAIQRAGGGAAR